jgi:formate C-acetyltransferase
MNETIQTLPGRPSTAVAAAFNARPAAPTGRAGLKRLINLLDYYFARGGMQLQFNVVSRATLEAAQRDPDKYRSLIVRVAGYSAYFVGLDKTVQQDIIERTEERLQ